MGWDWVVYKGLGTGGHSQLQKVLRLVGRWGSGLGGHLVCKMVLDSVGFVVTCLVPRSDVEMDLDLAGRKELCLA